MRFIEFEGGRDAPSTLGGLDPATIARIAEVEHVSEANPEQDSGFVQIFTKEPDGTERAWGTPVHRVELIFSLGDFTPAVPGFLVETSDGRKAPVIGFLRFAFQTWPLTASCEAP